MFGNGRNHDLSPDPLRVGLAIILVRIRRPQVPSRGPTSQSWWRSEEKTSTNAQGEVPMSGRRTSLHTQTQGRILPSPKHRCPTGSNPSEAIGGDVGAA